MLADDLPATPDQRSAKFAAVCFALTLPTVATFAYAVLLSGDPVTKLLYPASKVVQFAFPVAWVVLFERRRLRLAKPSASGLGIGGLFGGLVVAAMLALYYGFLRGSSLFAAVPKAIGDQLTDFGVTSLSGFLVLAVFIALIHSLAEEYYWRWFVFGQLRDSLPLTAAIAISSLGFMAHHVLVVGKFLSGYGALTWFFSLSVAVGGALWAWLYHRTTKLYAPWLSHFLVDAGLMWVGYDLWTMAARQ